MQVTKHNTTKQELKYPEASRSSLRKLVLGKLNLKEAMHASNSNLFTSMINLMNLRKWKDPHVILGLKIIPSFSDHLSVLLRTSFLAEWLPCFCSKQALVVSYLLKQNITRLWLGFWSTKRGEKASQGHGFSYLGEAGVSNLSFASCCLARLLLSLSLSLSFKLVFFSLFSLSLKISLSFSSSLFHDFSLKFLEKEEQNGSLRV